MQMFNPYDPYDLSLLFLLVLLVVLGGLLLLRLFRRKARFPWESRESLLSPAECAFLAALEETLGENFRVFPRVPLIDLLKPRNRVGKGRAQEAAEKLADIQLDFVVCRRKDLAIAGAVELGRVSRTPRSSVTEKSLEVAGIPLLRVDHDSPPEHKELRRILMEEGFLRLEPESGSSENWRLGSLSSAPAGNDEEDWRLGGESQPPAIETAPARDTETPPAELRCPACGAATVLRKVATGPRAGEIFRVCSRYPECREVRPTGRKGE